MQNGDGIVEDGSNAKLSNACISPYPTVLLFTPYFREQQAGIASAESVQCLVEIRSVVKIGRQTILGNRNRAVEGAELIELLRGRQDIMLMFAIPYDK